VIERGRCNVLRFVECFHLGRGTVTEALVEAVVVEPGDPSTIASSSCVRVRQTRSAISSVLKLSTKLSAIALSSASPTEPIDARRPWSSRTWLNAKLVYCEPVTLSCLSRRNLKR
jgi:hypothetical protein